MGWDSNRQPSPGHQIEAPNIPASIHVQAIATQRSTTRLCGGWLGFFGDRARKKRLDIFRGLRHRTCQYKQKKHTNVDQNSQATRKTMAMEILFKKSSERYNIGASELARGNHAQVIETSRSWLFCPCVWGFHKGMMLVNLERLPSRELTCPTLGKGKSSSKVPFWGDMLVPWRVSSVKYNKARLLYHVQWCSIILTWLVLFLDFKWNYVWNKWSISKSPTSLQM